MLTPVMSERPKVPRRHVDELRGATKLAIEATRGVTELVEAMHRDIASGPRVLGSPLAKPARVLTGLVYGSIKGVTNLIGAGVDAALARLAPVLGESAPGREREAVLAALNGVLGDYLQETHNPLAIVMSLRVDGQSLELQREVLAKEFPDNETRLLILVHGSSMCDGQWQRNGHDHGAALAEKFGLRPIYVQYNSGLHVSTNGAELAGLLEQLVCAWPVDVEEIALLGHSMGGLVARSACVSGERAGHAWRRKLHKMVFLGTPHHGAPLERGGQWLHFLMGISHYSAPLGRLAKIRSAGVTDLRYGNVLDEHWRGLDRFALGKDNRTPLPLPTDVDCFAIAGTTSSTMSARLPGDGLVPIDSALGTHARAELTLDFREDRRFIAMGTGHLDLLDSSLVFDRVRDWFG